MTIIRLHISRQKHCATCNVSTYIHTATSKIIKQVMFSIFKGKCPCILVVEGEIRTCIYAGSIPNLSSKVQNLYSNKSLFHSRSWIKLIGFKETTTAVLMNRWTWQWIYSNSKHVHIQNQLEDNMQQLIRLYYVTPIVPQKRIITFPDLN